MTAALQLRRVCKNYGITEILRDVDLEIEKGEKHAIIGPNGAGKSTLFHVISGRTAPTRGEIRLNGAPIAGLPPFRINRMGLARNFQVTNIFPRLSVFENIRCALLWRSGLGFVFWRTLDGVTEISARAQDILAQIGLSGRADLPAGILTYAEQRSLEIGITIASGADVIMLDEPTAGMSRSETDHAIGLIERISRGKTLVIVEHDMDVVFRLADRISVLVYGKVIATDTPERIRDNPDVRDAYLGHMEEDAPVEPRHD